jgi:hypothetical protein
MVIHNVFAITRCKNLTGAEFDLVTICNDAQHVSLEFHFYIVSLHCVNMMLTVQGLYG